MKLQYSAYRKLLPSNRSDSLMNHFSDPQKYRFIRIVSSGFGIYHTVFDDDQKLKDFVDSHVSSLTCHEIVLENCCWFADIDLNAKNPKKSHEKIQDIVSDFLRSSEAIFHIQINYYLVFTSGNQSIHIVCPEIVARDPKHFRDYAEQVSQNMKYSSYLDKVVYRSKTQLRILGSSKGGRKKVFRQELSLTPQVPNDLELFRLSLISTYHSFVKLEAKPFETPSSDCESSLPIDENFEAIQNLLSRFDPNFRIQGIENQIITLKRIRPSYCYICRRYHENENPFLVINRSGDVKFYCRRNNIPKILGTLENFEVDEPRIQKSDVEISNWDLLWCKKEDMMS